MAEALSTHSTPTAPTGSSRPIVGPTIGLLLASIALSSLLDDSGLIPHPTWIVLLIILGALAALLAVRTVRLLLRPAPVS